jgi:hypothetical protein
MNEGLASPEGPGNCNPDTMYRFWSDQASFRSQMQHKCVELSLQITTGLVAGVFALMVTKSSDPSALNSATRVCFVIVVNLYTMLQLLILANYLFHTFLMMIHWLGPREFSQKYDKAIDAILVQKITPPSPSEKARAAFLSCFQPLIIYFSGFIGSATCLGLALWLLWPLYSVLDRFLVITPIFFLGGLYILGRFHTNIDRLAKCWAWVYIKEEDKSLLHLLRNWRRHARELSRKH